MSTRPLRQYYEPVTATVPDVASAPGPWLAHRRRFVDALRGLPDRSGTPRHAEPSGT